MTVDRWAADRVFRADILPVDVAMRFRRRRFARGAWPDRVEDDDATFAPPPPRLAVDTTVWPGGVPDPPDIEGRARMNGAAHKKPVLQPTPPWRGPRTYPESFASNYCEGCQRLGVKVFRTGSPEEFRYRCAECWATEQRIAAMKRANAGLTRTYTLRAVHRPFPDALTVDEVAHRLGVSPFTVRSWVRAGLLARCPEGGYRVLIRESEVARLLAETYRPPSIRRAEAVSLRSAFGGESSS